MIDLEIGKKNWNYMGKTSVMQRLLEGKLHQCLTYLKMFYLAIRIQQIASIRDHLNVILVAFFS